MGEILNVLYQGLSVRLLPELTKQNCCIKGNRVGIIRLLMEVLVIQERPVAVLEKECLKSGKSRFA